MKIKANFTWVHILALSTVLLVSACSRTPPVGVKIGDPYTIQGKTYYPEYDPSYDEIGEASWYGPGFHGKKTASGERFNENDLTAAHPTLPMPSLVRVTNLKNGKSIVVRINDRGPFKSKRIIDLSRKSAERINMHSTMKVRVQYLPKETEEFLATMRATGKAPDMFAYNERISKGLNAPEPAPKVVVAREQEEEQDDAEEVPVESVRAPVDQTTVQAAPAENISVTDTMAAPTTSKEVKLIGMRDQPEQEIQPLVQPFSQPPVKGVGARQQAMPATKSAEVPPLFAAPAAAPQDSDASAQAGGYYIQVGSFSNPENAQKRVRGLASVGNATTDKVIASGKEWWRVKLGPFDSKHSASSALEKLRDSIPDARIIH